MQLSIIIPALNEAGGIETMLTQLQALRAQGHEVILVDGGSVDATVALATPLADCTLSATRGRAAQMNAGAAVARAEVLWFLHADTQITMHSAHCIIRALRAGEGWGRFDIRLSGTQPLLRVVESLINWRSRLSGIATGDQGLFVSRALFEQVGGFPDLPLMEDVELSKRLKRIAPPHCLREVVQTSSRRWEQRGVMRTILLMWSLRLAHYFGVPAERLASHYD